jgi:hypothetical protein
MTRKEKLNSVIEKIDNILKILESIKKSDNKEAK